MLSSFIPAWKNKQLQQTCMRSLDAESLTRALTQTADGGGIGCAGVRAGYEVVQHLPAGAVQGLLHGMSMRLRACVNSCVFVSSAFYACERCVRAFVCK